jgi:3-oxoacyl-[acyl-carrier protein] reductase
LTDMSAAHADHLAPSIPLQRVASPDEIAGLVAYLGRQESGYMTGASLTIDGGLSL